MIKIKTKIKKTRDRRDDLIITKVVFKVYFDPDIYVKYSLRIVYEYDIYAKEKDNDPSFHTCQDEDDDIPYELLSRLLEALDFKKDFTRKTIIETS